jgi:2-polyprenyl-3-methyl-5-hydroxy-6-metoxy-1,4-benzoquinol methylase
MNLDPSKISGENYLTSPIDTIPEAPAQTESRRWWDANPMSYDWHKTIVPAEGTREFYEEIDRRFFSSSSFYRGPVPPGRPFTRASARPLGRPFERWIPFDLLRGKRVLEVGCGLGSHAQLMSEAGCNLTCIDLTDRAVENTRRRLDLCGLPADVRRMDAEKMDFGDGEFDFVWSWGVIHHSEHTELILEQVYRVLKSGGEFRFMVYHRPSLSGLYSLGRGFFAGKFFQGMSVPQVLSFYTDGYLARFYTRRELRDLLLRCGFARIETRILGQKSELLPLPGKGALGSLKRVLLRAIPDRVAEQVLSAAGYFLFAIAHKDAPKS